VWDLANQKSLQTIPNAGQSAIISPDGKLVAAVEEFPDLDEQGQPLPVRTVIQVYEVDTGKPVSTLTAKTVFSIWNPLNVETVGMFFSAEGKTLQAANNFGDVRIWDVSSGRLLNSSTNENTRARLSLGHCEAAGRSADGFALSCYISYLDPPCIEETPNCFPESRIRFDIGMWGADRLQRFYNISVKNPPGVDLHLFYDPAQRKAGLLDASIQTIYWPALNGSFEVQTLKQAQDPALSEMEETCQSCATLLALNSTGAKLAVAHGSQVLLVDLTRGEVVQTFENALDMLTSAALGVKDKRPVLATGHSDGSLSVVELSGGAQVRTIAQAHTQSVSQLAFSGEDLLSVGRDGLIQFWLEGQTTPEQTFGTALVYDAFTSVYRFAFNQATNRLSVDKKEEIEAAVSQSSLTIHDLRSGKVLIDLPTSARVVAFSQDGRWLAAGTTDAAIFNAENGALLREFSLPEDDEFVLGIALSPDGSLLATSQGSKAIIWNVNTSQVFAELDFSDYLATRLDFSPSGCLLAAGNSGGQITLVDVKSGQVLAQWWGHAGRVETLAFSEDGRLLLSKGVDGKARVWGQPGALALPAGRPQEQTCRLSAPPVTSTPVTPTATAAPLKPTATATLVTFYRELSLTDPVMTGIDVLQLQQRLYDLGYVEVGRPDGVFGSKTDQAVRRFQERNGLVIDGIVGPITWQRLFSQAAVR
jgi:WD40 repeat protein